MKIKKNEELDTITRSKITKITLSTSYKYKVKIILAIARLLNVRVGLEYPFVYHLKNNKVYKPGDPYRDGITVEAKWPDNDGMITLDGGIKVQVKTTEDGILYYKHKGQKYYLIYG